MLGKGGRRQEGKACSSDRKKGKGKRVRGDVNERNIGLKQKWDGSEKRNWNGD